MACGSCGGGGGARAVEKWIYQAANGTRTEYSSKSEADMQVSKNGSGVVYRKP